MPYKDHEVQLQAQKDNYNQNKGKYYANLIKRRTANRQWIIDYKKDKSCKCGENHPSCLDFHHLDPNTKDITVSDAIVHWGLKRLKSEIAKCVIICANCHRKIHWTEHH